MRAENTAEALESTSTSAPQLRKTDRLRRPSEIFRKLHGEPERPRGWGDAALVAVFLISISLPLAGMILRLDSGFVLEENRVLAARPELKLDRPSLAQFPAKFEAYFNDQLGFRKRLINWQNILKVAVLGVSPSPNVILGRNQWLYWGDLDIQYYRVLRPFRPEHLVGWQRLLESRRDWLAGRGIRYLVVIPPNKSTIYPEYMPRVYNRLHSESRLDQLMAHLRAHSTLTVIDLRAPLFAAKAREQIYYRTDTHWNNRGAFVGYSKMMEVLSVWFPQIKAMSRSDFRDVTKSEQGRDLPLVLAMRHYYWENYSDIELVKPRLAHEIHETANGGAPSSRLPKRDPDFIFEHSDQSLPRAVMFRDSYATWLIPLLSEHFRRIVFTWQYTLDRVLVEQEHPDVVIQEMLERTLMLDASLPSP